jgi:hypothetical protein
MSCVPASIGQRRCKCIVGGRGLLRSLLCSPRCCCMLFVFDWSILQVMAVVLEGNIIASGRCLQGTRCSSPSATFCLYPFPSVGSVAGLVSNRNLCIHYVSSSVLE